jgi:hypothetical protein
VTLSKGSTQTENHPSTQPSFDFFFFLTIRFEKEKDDAGPVDNGMPRVVLYSAHSLDPVDKVGTRFHRKPAPIKYISKTIS